MKEKDPALTTDVDLSCRIYWGATADLQLSAAAVSIEPGSMTLRLQKNGKPHPEVGERVELQVFLPVKVTTAAPKCLSCRAEVVRINDAEDGRRQLFLSFRKAVFRDLIPSLRPGARKGHRVLKKAVAQ